MNATKDIPNCVNGTKAIVLAEEDLIVCIFMLMLLLIKLTTTLNKMGMHVNNSSVGCKNTWEERNHVKSHTIQNMEVFFCLNCDDWIQEKAAVFDKGWTMFDEAGALSYDI